MFVWVAFSLLLSGNIRLNDVRWPFRTTCATKSTKTNKGRMQNDRDTIMLLWFVVELTVNEVVIRWLVAFPAI